MYFVGHMAVQAKFLQTPSMATRTCWRCGAVAHMTRKSDPTQTRPLEEIPQVFQATFSCDQCGWFQFASVSGALSLSDAQRLLDLGEDQIVSWHPQVGSGKDFPDVPAQIADAADEAYRCYSIQAYRGAVALARAVIEATAKAKEILSGQIYQKIEELAAQGHIRQHIREAAHEVRFLGNEVAHGDFVDPVDAEEAEDILALMGEVLQEVFQSPARVARVRANREAKKAAAGE